MIIKLTASREIRFLLIRIIDKKLVRGYLYDIDYYINLVRMKSMLSIKQSRFKTIHFI